MTKIVVNRCFGGFAISLKAAKYMAERGHELAKREIADYMERKRLVDFKIKNSKWPDNSDPERTKWLEIDVELKLEYPEEKDEFPKFYGYGHEEGYYGYQRDDPLLVEAVETLKEKSWGSHARLEVVEIPDEIIWEIDEYDGNERIVEKHRSW